MPKSIAFVDAAACPYSSLLDGQQSVQTILNSLMGSHMYGTPVPLLRVNCFIVIRTQHHEIGVSPPKLCTLTAPHKNCNISCASCLWTCAPMYLYVPSPRQAFCGSSHSPPKMIWAHILAIAYCNTDVPSKTNTRAAVNRTLLCPMSLCALVCGH